MVDYATITGRITFPGSDTALPCLVTAVPRTRATGLVLDDRVTLGVVSKPTDEDGYLPTDGDALKIPVVEATGGVEVIWDFVAEPLGPQRGGAGTVGLRSWVFYTGPVTATTTVQALAETAPTALVADFPPSVLAQVVEARDDAQTAAAAAQAVGAIADEQVAYSIGTPGNAGAEALSVAVGYEFETPGSPAREQTDALYTTPVAVATAIDNALDDYDASAFIYHGANGNTPRGDGGGSRVWVGSVYPNNRLPGDVWLVATQKAIEPTITYTAIYDASKLTLADLAAVDTWPDTSGHGNNATQATASLRPTFRVASGPEAAYVRFAGKWLRSAFAAAIPQPWTIALAVNLPTISTATGDTRQYVGGVGAPAGLIGRNSLWQVTAGTTVTATGANPALSTGKHVIVLEVANGGATLSVDRVRRTLTGVGANGLNGVTLAASYQDTTPAEVDLYQARIYPGILSTSQRADLESYLAGVLGISLP